MKMRGSHLSVLLNSNSGVGLVTDIWRLHREATTTNVNGSDKLLTDMFVRQYLC